MTEIILRLKLLPLMSLSDGASGERDIDTVIHIQSVTLSNASK